MSHLSLVAPSTLLYRVVPPAGLILGIVAVALPNRMLFGLVIALGIVWYIASLFISKHTPHTLADFPDSIAVENDKLKVPLSELEKDMGSSLRHKLQIVPVLTQQLQMVIQQTDEAAGGLTEAFFGINRQAKNQLQSVQNLFGSLSEQASANNFLSQTKQNLHEIQENFSTMTSFFDKTQAFVSDIVEQLHRVEGFASNIETVGETTGILALNASIQAAKSGEAGNSFKTIASEINSLSKSTNTSVKEISAITESLKEKVSIIKQELKMVHTHSVEMGKRTDDLFNLTIQKINERLNETAEVTKNISDGAERLTKDISKIVVSIQFQDITRQRIEHVITPLETLRNEINALLDSLMAHRSGQPHLVGGSTVDSLLQHYTMESERELAIKVLQQEQ